MRHAVVVGAGYVGGAVAKRLAADDWRVTAIVHSEKSAHETGALALDVTKADIVNENAALFEEAEVIVYCVSSGRGGADAYRSAYVEGLANVLKHVRQSRLVFTSSTSVYAQTDGSAVDETSRAEPDRETGQILREAEELTLGLGGSVARLGGIYGPGRSVYLKKFLDFSARIEGDGSRWVNQIHRDDAASALVRLVSESVSPGIYNVVDDTPMTQRAIYELLSEFFQKPMPPSGPIDLHRKRGRTSKQVSNARLRALGWEPEYPGYGEAIRRWGALLLEG